MELLLKLVRWALALVLGFIAWRALSLGDIVPGVLMLAGALVILPPAGALVARFAAPVARHAVAIGLGFALVLCGLAIAGLDSERAPVAAEPPGANDFSTDGG